MKESVVGADTRRRYSLRARKSYKEEGRFSFLNFVKSGRALKLISVDSFSHSLGLMRQAVKQVLSLWLACFAAHCLPPPPPRTNLHRINELYGHKNAAVEEDACLLCIPEADSHDQGFQASTKTSDAEAGGGTCLQWQRT